MFVSQNHPCDALSVVMGIPIVYIFMESGIQPRHIKVLCVFILLSLLCNFVLLSQQFIRRNSAALISRFIT